MKMLIIQKNTFENVDFPWSNSTFLRKPDKLEDQCTIIFHISDWPEVAYEIDFSKNSWTTKIGFEKVARFYTFLGHDFGRFLRIICKCSMMLARRLDGKCCQGLN